MITTLKDLHTLVVHKGTFHADDVFTTAYLKMAVSKLYDRVLEVVRTYDITPAMNENPNVLIADIGLGEFDHHQSEDKKQKRENGCPYAAFGLVVKAFHEGIFTDDEYALFDKKFISPLDYSDNYGSVNELSNVIRTFNVQWDDDLFSNPTFERCQFDAAVNLAIQILNSEIRYIKSLCKAKEIANNAKPINFVVYLDKYAPISEFFANDVSVEFIGSPSLRGGYQIVSVMDQNGNKRLLPIEYRGFSSKIPNEVGMLFCHPNGFMATFSTKELAMNFMNKMYNDLMKERK